MRCEKVPELKLNDGATRIFLNTRGKHPELVSPELIELLKYMERSTDEVSRECKSKRIQEMHRRVCQIKASEKAEVKYMQTWEEKILIKQAGIAEGEQIGRSKEKTELVKKLSNKFSIEQIAEMLEIDISEVEKIIKEIRAKESVKRHLQNLGFIAGEKIEVISENNSGIILMIKGSKIALNKGMANKIIVQ